MQPKNERKRTDKRTDIVNDYPGLPMCTTLVQIGINACKYKALKEKMSTDECWPGGPSLLAVLQSNFVSQTHRRRCPKKMKEKPYTVLLALKAVMPSSLVPFFEKSFITIVHNIIILFLVNDIICVNFYLYNILSLV